MKTTSFSSRFLLIFSLLLSSLTFAGEYGKTSLFDGETLTGWKPVKEENAKFWEVRDGVIIGSNSGEKVPTNTYLISKKEYGDF